MLTCCDAVRIHLVGSLILVTPGIVGLRFLVALGAKGTTSEQSVVALTDDGGLMYALPERATAVHYRVVW